MAVTMYVRDQTQVRLKRLSSVETNFGWCFTWRTLCGGHIQCRQELAMVIGPALADDGATYCSVALAAGYVEYAPGRWRLGNHARRSPRQAPRRPRFTSMPSGQAAPGYVRDGLFMVRGPNGRPDMPVRLPSDALGRWKSAPQLITLGPGQVITIECPRCRRVSALGSETAIQAASISG